MNIKADFNHFECHAHVSGDLKLRVMFVMLVLLHSGVPACNFGLLSWKFRANISKKCAPARAAVEFRFPLHAHWPL